MTSYNTITTYNIIKQAFHQFTGVAFDVAWYINIENLTWEFIRLAPLVTLLRNIVILWWIFTVRDSSWGHILYFYNL